MVDEAIYFLGEECLARDDQERERDDEKTKAKTANVLSFIDPFPADNGTGVGTAIRTASDGARGNTDSVSKVGDR